VIAGLEEDPAAVVDLLGQRGVVGSQHEPHPARKRERRWVDPEDDGAQLGYPPPEFDQGLKADGEPLLAVRVEQHGDVVGPPALRRVDGEGAVVDAQRHVPELLRRRAVPDADLHEPARHTHLGEGRPVEVALDVLAQHPEALHEVDRQPQAPGCRPPEDDVARGEPRIVQPVDQMVIDAFVEPERGELVEGPDPVGRQGAVDEVDPMAPPRTGVGQLVQHRHSARPVG
jgi:hypothetical protein